jgi:hypothetical protein
VPIDLAQYSRIASTLFFKNPVYGRQANRTIISNNRSIEVDRFCDSGQDAGEVTPDDRVSSRLVSNEA